MLGGIIVAIVAEAAIVPNASFAWYPCRSISGIAVRPRTAADARLEPEAAAKAAAPAAAAKDRCHLARLLGGPRAPHLQEIARDLHDQPEAEKEAPDRYHQLRRPD